MVPDVDELGDGDPVEVARENARRKAEAVETDAVVIGVDTLVTVEGEIFGKPRDAEHAREMLERLSGKTHRVVSGLALKRDSVEVVHDTTEVTFRPVKEMLQWYLAHEEWRERAGGYAIQGRGAAFVDCIVGDYLNVVGLPVSALLDLWPEVLKVAR